ncbi:Aminotransferase class I and II family protein [uncultured delta proteobacterium]|uniref:Aminotransferase n=1 Tax=uncultured delta proteobacterium TaxID=34034 RepID=A0A212J840_9DELT|nr:Aminotransferase class I and II family protein [uncultured delta proteobacterium]
MSLVTKSIAGQLQSASWIRRMFEAGTALKKQYGEDAVCDFSLGNPDLPAPPAVAEGLKNVLAIADQPFAFGYMPNAGFPWAREALAKHLSKEQGAPLTSDDVILTCGAAGALNVVFKTILEAGDEVLAIAPYFVEYGGYAGNHGGVLKAVPSNPDDFSLDLAALEKAIGPRTRALIINSPNNPTGQIYSKESLVALSALLLRKGKENGRPIFLLLDEPYRFLNFEGGDVPSVLPLYPYAILASSFSKNLSLPGERVGYIAVSPSLEGRGELVAGLILANRILGFVNPPVIGQHIMVAALGSQADVSVYAARRKAMAEVLTRAGYEFFMPKGAFYFFPKAPGGDDVAFVNRLQEERVLAVPGSGFAGPGHFRLTFCVGEDVIRRAENGLKRARDAFPA